MKKAFFLLALFVGIAYSCSKDKTAEATTTTTTCDSTITYTNTIKSIMDANCISCHKTGSINGGVNLETYNLVKSSSKLVCVVKRSCTPMPPSASLDASDITKIECWVNNGYKN